MAGKNPASCVKSPSGDPGPSPFPARTIGFDSPGPSIFASDGPFAVATGATTSPRNAAQSTERSERLFMGVSLVGCACYTGRPIRVPLRHSPYGGDPTANAVAAEWVRLGGGRSFSISRRRRASAVPVRSVGRNGKGLRVDAHGRRRARIRRSLRAVLLLPVLLIAAGTATYTASAPAAGPNPKVEQSVIDQVNANGKATFWVILKEKADLSDVSK